MSTPETFDRYTPRRDVVSVAPQGGYVAKRCPLRVQFDVLPPAGVERLPVPAATRARMDAGIEFEAAVFDELASLHPEAVRLGDELRASERVAVTVAAMA